MNKLWRGFIRMSSFLRKEVFVILRQPRLVLTLILGPFLILLIFGIGYRNEARALRTLFVAQSDSPIARQIDEYATTLGPQLIYRGVTGDTEQALELLRRGEVDVVAVTPNNAQDKIRNNEQAVFTLYHREIDPFQVDYVTYFGQIYIDEVNRRVLTAITEEGQSDAGTVQDDLAEARQNASTLRQALEAGNEAAAAQERGKLENNLDAVSLAMGASLGLLSGVDQEIGSGGATTASEILAALQSAQQNMSSLSTASDSGESNQARIERVREIESDLTLLEEQLGEFTHIEAHILVRPFTIQSESIAAIQPTPLDFFAPAVIALLLQHLAVTFAALSIVGERTVGTMELFRVSPLSAAEALMGKYLSYLIFGFIITLVLTLLVYFGLRVPMLGSWWDYALVAFVLVFTSLSIGFVISLLSENESQAVQYTMIVLLTSVFFSGFLLALELIWQPVRVLSWLLPTTYGIVLFRDIFLRGDPVNLSLLGGLAAIGLVLMVVAWLLMRRLISSK